MGKKRNPLNLFEYRLSRSFFRLFNGLFVLPFYLFFFFAATSTMAEVIVAEVIAAEIIKVVLQKLADEAFKRFVRSQGIHSELKNLEKTMYVHDPEAA